MSCKCPEDSVNFTYAVSYRIRNSKPFTKVTSPLGSRAEMRWGSSPHARTRPPQVLLRRLNFYRCRRSYPFIGHLQKSRPKAAFSVDSHCCTEALTPLPAQRWPGSCQTGRPAGPRWYRCRFPYGSRKTASQTRCRHSGKRTPRCAPAPRAAPVPGPPAEPGGKTHRPSRRRYIAPAGPGTGRRKCDI